MSRRNAKAKLGEDGVTVSCSSCRTPLGLRFLDPDREEHFLYLDSGWVHDREDRIWRSMRRTASAHRQDRRSTRRNLEGYTEPMGHIPYNLPQRLQCLGCGTDQLAEPDRLRVSANPAPIPEHLYEGPVAFEIPRANVELALRHTARTE